MKPTARETAAAHRLAEAMIEFLSARDEAADIRRRESEASMRAEASPRLVAWNQLNEEQTRELGLLTSRDAARFLGCQPKDEIRRKTILVPFDLFVKPLGRHAVNRCQISIKNHRDITNVTDGNFHRAGHWHRVHPVGLEPTTN